MKTHVASSITSGRAAALTGCVPAIANRSNGCTAQSPWNPVPDPMTGLQVRRHFRLNRIHLLALVVCAPLMGASSGTISNWNVIGVQATLTAGENAIAQSRTLAILHVAIHDAVNTIDPRYRRYAY